MDCLLLSFIGVIATIANNEKLMKGKQNSLMSNTLVLLTLVVLSVSGLFFVYALVTDFLIK